MILTQNEQSLDELFILTKSQEGFMSVVEREDKVGKLVSKSVGDLLGELYIKSPNNYDLEITDDFFSNIANIQVTNTDVTIDFLLFPGVNKDNTSYIRGKRVHIPHSTAQKLAQIILDTLNRAYKEGTIDQYKPEIPSANAKTP